METTIGIIGCGVMGSAIATHLVHSAKRVVVYDTDEAKIEALIQQEPAIGAVTSLEALFVVANTAILAVKPQILRPLCRELASYKNVGWISIAAGISLDELTDALSSRDVVRLLPNIGAKRGQSVTALAVAPECSAAHRTMANAVAEAFGEVYEIAEELFSAFIGISGSAIAFILEFVHALAMGGVSEGIPYPQALQIATATMKSTTALLDGGEHPVMLASSVCSAGGTTVEGMAALADGAFDAIVMRAVRASSERSRELEAEASHHRSDKD
jgi:pyrroline-5-carboxylate reductase